MLRREDELKNRRFVSQFSPQQFVTPVGIVILCSVLFLRTKALFKMEERVAMCSIDLQTRTYPQMYENIYIYIIVVDA